MGKNKGNKGNSKSGGKGKGKEKEKEKEEKENIPKKETKEEERKRIRREEREERFAHRKAANRRKWSKIPLDPSGGFTYTFDVSFADTNTESFPDLSVVEHVEVVATIKHPQRNKLTISVTSPHDSVSVLTEPHMVGLIPTLFFDEPEQIRDLYFVGNGTGFGPSLSFPVRGGLVTLDGGCDLFNTTYDGSLFLLKLKQSECSPVTQVYHAQLAGAVGVAFIPDYLGPLHYLDVNVDTSKIAIPSMQLDPYMGSLLFEYLYEAKGVRIVARIHSVIYPQHDYTNFPFLSMRHWGEGAVGKWTVTVTDFPSEESTGGDGVRGVVGSLSLRLWGTGFNREYIYSPPREAKSRKILLIFCFTLISIAVGSIAAVYYHSHMTKVDIVGEPSPDQNYDPMAIDSNMHDVTTEDDENATL